MKKLLKSALFLALFGTIFIGCEKEDAAQPNSTNSINNIETSSKKGVLNSKTAYTDFELAAMAANINTISYTSGIYTITFHDGTPNHTISINSFDDESLIDYDVTNTGTSTTTNTEINVINEDIDIQTVGTFTFSAYETYSITSSDPVLKNIVPVFTIHKIMNGTATASFTNNGTNDDFIPDTGAGLKFWGNNDTFLHKSGGMGGSPCYKTYSRQESRFWFPRGDPYAWTDTDNPVPC